MLYLCIHFYAYDINMIHLLLFSVLLLILFLLFLTHIYDVFILQIRMRVTLMNMVMRKKAMKMESIQFLKMPIVLQKFQHRCKSPRTIQKRRYKQKGT